MYHWPVIVLVATICGRLWPLIIKPYHDTACRISLPFLDIFWTIISTTPTSDYNCHLQSDDRLNLYSSENSTDNQSCSAQLRCSRHHCKRTVQCCLVNWTHTTSLRADCLPPFKRLATVFEDLLSCGSKKPICRLLSCDVPVPFCR